jgi:RNA polymerase sigma factor (sigma-70 family)
MPSEKPPRKSARHDRRTAMNARAANQALATLTAREREVLHWVCECKTDAEIGKILGISVHTVSKHLQRAFRKLGVENRMAAARFTAFAQGHHGRAETVR